MMESSIAKASDMGLRFDNVLAGAANITRSQAKILIDQGIAKVNGKSVKVNQKILADDKITWVLKAFPGEVPLAEDIRINILYEDDYILAVNKPANLVVHPGAGNSTGTLLNGLLFYDEVFSHVERSGIVHILDKDTSGVIIVAKNNQIKDALQNQFKNRLVSKSYLSLVYGIPINNLRIENNIGRHKVNRKKQSVLKDGGKKAISIIKIQEKFKNSSLVRINIMTGRTHQIRVHLAHIGHPILGDTLYGRNKSDFIGKELIKRQMLHAQSLNILHPITNKDLLLEAPIPNDINIVIQNQRELV